MFVVPVDFDQSWVVESYRNIPSHQLSHSDQGGLIQVRKSASPLVYPFKNGLMIHGFEVQGELSGQVKLASEDIQGSAMADDFHFRFGLVKDGEQTLNFATKLLAPHWVKTLYALAPKEAGIEKVEFYNLSYDERIPWKTRAHPLSELLEENIAKTISKEGPFHLKVQFEKPMKIWGLWLSSDGDDTKASFDIRIDKIQLLESPSNK